eukprot:Rhum_TRINITY_DN8478_c0_g6::Rhum_TRINITY_DN8478_c0_g6_i1::g.28137::m.28137
MKGKLKVFRWHQKTCKQSEEKGTRHVHRPPHHAKRKNTEKEDKKDRMDHRPKKEELGGVARRQRAPCRPRWGLDGFACCVIGGINGCAVDFFLRFFFFFFFFFFAIVLVCWLLLCVQSPLENEDEAKEEQRAYPPDRRNASAGIQRIREKDGDATKLEIERFSHGLRHVRHARQPVLHSPAERTGPAHVRHRVRLRLTQHLCHGAGRHPPGAHARLDQRPRQVVALVRTRAAVCPPGERQVQRQPRPRAQEGTEVLCQQHVRRRPHGVQHRGRAALRVRPRQPPQDRHHRRHPRPCRHEGEVRRRLLPRRVVHLRRQHERPLDAHQPQHGALRRLLEEAAVQPRRHAAALLPLHRDLHLTLSVRVVLRCARDRPRPRRFLPVCVAQTERPVLPGLERRDRPRRGERQRQGVASGRPHARALQRQARVGVRGRADGRVEGAALRRAREGVRHGAREHHGGLDGHPHGAGGAIHRAVVELHDRTPRHLHEASALHAAGEVGEQQPHAAVQLDVPQRLEEPVPHVVRERQRVRAALVVRGRHADEAGVAAPVGDVDAHRRRVAALLRRVPCGDEERVRAAHHGPRRRRQTGRLLPLHRRSVGGGGSGSGRADVACLNVLRAVPEGLVDLETDGGGGTSVRGGRSDDVPVHTVAPARVELNAKDADGGPCCAFPLLRSLGEVREGGVPREEVRPVDLEVDAVLRARHAASANRRVDHGGRGKAGGGVDGAHDEPGCLGVEEGVLLGHVRADVVRDLLPVRRSDTLAEDAALHSALSGVELTLVLLRRHGVGGGWCAAEVAAERRRALSDCEGGLFVCVNASCNEVQIL